MVVELKVGLRFFFGTTDSTPRSRWRKRLADGVGKFGLGGNDGQLACLLSSLSAIGATVVQLSSLNMY